MDFGIMLKQQAKNQDVMCTEEFSISSIHLMGEKK